MRAAVLLLITPLLGSAAFAGDPIPSRYAAGPFLAPVEVINLSPPEVAAFCEEYAVQDAAVPMGTTYQLACALFSKGNDLGWDLRMNADHCSIFIIDKSWPGWATTSGTYESSLQHEEAHCRGWPPDHPK